MGRSIRAQGVGRGRAQGADVIYIIQNPLAYEFPELFFVEATTKADQEALIALIPDGDLVGTTDSIAWASESLATKAADYISQRRNDAIALGVT